MSYLLSKLLPLFVYPLGLAIILCFFLLLFSRNKEQKWVRPTIVAVILLLWIPSTSVFADFVLGSLEKKYPPVPLQKFYRADAIVILGGMTRGVVDKAGTVELSESVDRLLYGAKLYKAKKAPVVLLSGGNMEGFTPEAVQMAKILEQIGVPIKAMVLETRSRNTYQNAVNIKPMLKENRIRKILLVTSAFHMKRALGLFNAMGVKAIPAPTDYQVLPKESSVLDWVPSADALNRTTIGLKEYLGWWYYSFKGWVNG